jgi:dienelactone hydrolase
MNSRFAFFANVAFIPLLSVAWCLPSPGAEYPDHSNLLIRRDAEGIEHPVKSPEDWAKRRTHILEGMQAAMGPLPSRENFPPLDIRVTKTVEEEHCVRKHITFVPEEGDRLTAHLYFPKGGPEEKRPGIVALHPTNRAIGKDVVADLGPLRNRGYAVELARRGCVVIAPDYVNMGEYKFDWREAGYHSATMKGILNHMRCVDLLQSLDEVDPEKIGAIGHSLGGHNAMFLGVFDPRVKVIVSSCGWTPFHDYYGGDIKGWTHDGYMPLLATKYKLDPDLVPFDFYEIVAALAPRPFFSNSPLRDSNFDYRGVEKAIEKAGKVYALLGAEDRLQVRYPDCEHDFPPEVRKEAYETIDAALGFTPVRPGF